MVAKKIGITFFLFLTFILTLFTFSEYFKKDENIPKDSIQTEDLVYNSNIIEDVNYTTIDADGNEYIINALKGEIDFSNTKILFLTDVEAIIKLKNEEYITINSDFGKYNSDNFDTIFSKNVIIKYLENKITSEYLDFSLDRNLMIISRNVIYNNNENILNADVIELDLKLRIQKYLCTKKIR